MRDFYRQVYTDVKTRRFAAACSVCGKKEYGSRIPFACRHVKNPVSPKKGIRRLLYNKSLAVAVQELAIRFNLCRSCGDWVCDDCFCYMRAGGICKNCASEKNKLNETEGDI